MTKKNRGGDDGHRQEPPHTPGPEDPRSKLNRKQLMDRLNNQAVLFLQIHLSKLAEAADTEDPSATLAHLQAKMEWYLESTLRLFNVQSDPAEFEAMQQQAIDRAMTEVYQPPVTHLHRGEVLHERAVEQERLERIKHRQDRLLAEGKRVFSHNLSMGVEEAQRLAELTMRNTAILEHLYSDDEEERMEYEIKTFLRHFVLQAAKGRKYITPSEQGHASIAGEPDVETPGVIRPMVFGNASKDTLAAQQHRESTEETGKADAMDDATETGELIHIADFQNSADGQHLELVHDANTIEAKIAPTPDAAVNQGPTQGQRQRIWQQAGLHNELPAGEQNLDGATKEEVDAYIVGLVMGGHIERAKQLMHELAGRTSLYENDIDLILE